MQINQRNMKKILENTFRLFNFLRTSERKRVILSFVFLAFFLVFFFFNPAEGAGKYTLRLSWQAETSVPLDYPARSLPSNGSKIDVIASVYDSNGWLLPEGKFYFNWSVDGDYNFFDLSRGRLFQGGWGENSISFADTRLTDKPLKVEVTITDKRGNVKKTNIYIPHRSPLVLIYSDRSLLALSKFKADGREDIFRLKRYFFPEGDPLSFQWFLDGNVFSSSEEVKLKLEKAQEKTLSVHLVDSLFPGIVYSKDLEIY